MKWSGGSFTGTRMQRRCHGALSPMEGLEAGTQDVDKSRDRESRRRRVLSRVLCLVLATSLIVLLLPVLNFAQRTSIDSLVPLTARVQDNPAADWPPLPPPRWRACPKDPSKEERDRVLAQQEAGQKFLMVQLAGGLNQMRAGICDAVVVAHIMKAVLVLPMLDNTSWWADSSGFADVFDAPHFIRTLAPHVRIIPSLPPSLQGVAPLVKKAPRDSLPEYYSMQGLRFFKRRAVVRFDHFDSRLADVIPAPLQQPESETIHFLALCLPPTAQLRCKANYLALRFVPDVVAASEALLKALHGRLSSQQPHFVALHLRYEPDMLAFTGCDYGGSARERQQLQELRKRWPNLPPADPQGQKALGLCVTSPEQVALALQAIGIPPSVPLFIASGPLWRGTAALDPLRAHFPTILTKQNLAQGSDSAHGAMSTLDLKHQATSDGELSQSGHGEFLKQEASGVSGRRRLGLAERVLGRPALMAAVDYEICRRADVFVANNRGNMASLLTGHRRYDGSMDTVKVFGSKIHQLLSSASLGDSLAMAKLKEKLLRNTVARNSSVGTSGSTVSKESFYNFPGDCLCSIVD